ncbi:XDD3 family exosortase-dependent surface protein [Candidatus Parabeggiatoa sp. HSG14]|uniref:XDD3 family exosortase-dependent surface protein n=1 Tax=Candidatus Parabeggiatoa sp. HSG14 TaxID=3055593 RepID=UPI0025A8C210|nr:hypothetical protein [Thiotrichales bacterium HSG14]
MKKQYLLQNAIKQSLKSVVVASLSATFFMGLPVQADEIQQAGDGQCMVYAVHDRGLSDSQMIFFDPANALEMGGMGVEYPNYDLEAMDIDYTAPNGAGKLYVASGDDSVLPGHIFLVNKNSGALKDFGSTGYAEVDGISFNPVTNELWGWAQDDGLFKIPRIANNSTYPLNMGGIEMVFPTKGEFEDITWNEDGTKLYAVHNQKAGDPDANSDSDAKQTLIGYDISTGNVSEVCSDTIGKLVTESCSEIEAIDMAPNDSLIIGYHGCETLPVFAKLDPATCELTATAELKIPYDGILGGIPDIEGIAWPCPICPTGWKYAADSATDSTQIENPDDRSNVTVGGTDFEIYGMAIKDDGQSITVAFSANLPIGGIDASVPDEENGGMKDINMNWGDLMLDFGDNLLYGVHFTSNDSGVTELGVYEDITTKDVAADNDGWETLSQYSEKVSPNFEPLSFGDIEVDVFSPNPETLYFNPYESYNQPVVIASGKKVGDVEILDDSALADMGLDFAENIPSTGTQTFGFKFDKTVDMTNNFTAYIFEECVNDGVAIIAQCE